MERVNYKNENTTNRIQRKINIQDYFENYQDDFVICEHCLYNKQCEKYNLKKYSEDENLISNSYPKFKDYSCFLPNDLEECEDFIDWFEENEYIQVLNERQDLYRSDIINYYNDGEIYV